MWYFQNESSCLQFKTAQNPDWRTGLKCPLSPTEWPKTMIELKLLLRKQTWAVLYGSWKAGRGGGDATLSDIGVILVVPSIAILKFISQHKIKKRILVVYHSFTSANLPAFISVSISESNSTGEVQRDLWLMVYKRQLSNSCPNKNYLHILSSTIHWTEHVVAY